MNILKFLYVLIPSYARFGLIFKISLTVFLCGLCANLFYVKINPAFSMFKSAMTFSPVAKAEKYIAEDKLKTAEEYIDFYLTIPGARQKEELLALREKIHGQRTGIISGALHQGKHVWKGISGQESDEIGGQIGHAALEMSDFADVRDLYHEWQNYSSGKEVDKLSAGLAGVSLAMSLTDYAMKLGGLALGGASSATASAFITPARKTVGLIKKSLKFMNPRLKKACVSLFEPVFNSIRKTRLLDKLPMPRLSASSMLDKAAELKKFAQSAELKNYLAKNIHNLEHIASMMKGKLDDLGDIFALARKDPEAAKLLVQNSHTVKQLSSLSQKVLSLGKEGKNIFLFGGKNALSALEKLSRNVKDSAALLKESMRVGSTGLKALAKGCWHSLSRMVELAYKYKSVLWLLMFQGLLALLPLYAALLLELLFILIMLKSWGKSISAIFRRQREAM